MSGPWFEWTVNTTAALEEREDDLLAAVWALERVEGTAYAIMRAHAATLRRSVRSLRRQLAMIRVQMELDLLKRPGSSPLLLTAGGQSPDPAGDRGGHPETAGGSMRSMTGRWGGLSALLVGAALLAACDVSPTQPELMPPPVAYDCEIPSPECDPPGGGSQDPGDPFDEIIYKAIWGIDWTYQLNFDNNEYGGTWVTYSIGDPDGSGPLKGCSQQAGGTGASSSCDPFSFSGGNGCTANFTISITIEWYDENGQLQDKTYNVPVICQT